MLDIFTPYKCSCFETPATGNIWPEMGHNAVAVVVVVVVEEEVELVTAAVVVR